MAKSDSKQAKESLTLLEKEMKRRGLSFDDTKPKMDGSPPQTGSVNIASFCTDLRTGERFWSPQMWKICEMDPTQGVPDVRRWLIEYVHDDDLFNMAKNISILQEVGSCQPSYRFRKRDGSYMRLAFELAVIFDDHEPILIAGTARKIDEVDEKTFIRGAQLRHWDELAAQFPMYVAMVSDAEKVTYLNRDLPHLSRKTAMGASISDLFAGRYLQKIRAIFTKIRGGESHGDLEIRAEDLDGTHHFRIRIGPLTDGRGKVTAFVVATMDISAEVVAQKALVENEERYRRMVENSEVGVAIHNGTYLLFLNAAGRKMLFLQDVPIQDVQILDFVHPDDREKVANRIESVSKLKTVPPVELRFLRGDGEVIWVLVGGIEIVFDKKRCVQIEFQDITAIKKAREETRRVESRNQSLQSELGRLGTVIDQVDDSIYTTDIHGVILDVNRGFENMTGYSAAEARGQHINILKSGFHECSFFTKMWNTLLGGALWQGRVVNRHKSGRFFTEEGLISPVKNDVGEVVGMVGVMRDISEKLLLEEQLRQAQKMDGLGQLAGGVAHDFNNLLTLMLSSTQMLAESTLSNDQQEELEQIELAARRAETLTQQLLAFSRRQVMCEEEIALGTATSEAEAMLSRLLPSEIELIRKSHTCHCAKALNADEVVVKIDRGQLDQILMNLVLNAKDAMPGGGTVTLSFGCEEDPSGTIRAFFEVKDEGIGMSPDLVQKIFEPFFTTKDLGKGTGLGLSTVYGIVKQSGGEVVVESEEGVGTSFRIFLPMLILDQNRKMSKVPSEKPALFSGEAKVLLVEDDLGVQRVTVRLLKRMGCEVVVASDAEEALAFFEKETNPFDLLLTDVVMPGMRGPELARLLLSRQSNLKILYVSGYTEGELTDHDLERGYFLRKPFSPRQLSVAVETSLKGKTFRVP